MTVTVPGHCGRVLLAILVVLGIAAAPAVARHRQADAVPGKFDYYLLSLSIAPSFCALSPANGAKDECRSLTEAEFQQTPLTVHGLWPNRAGVSVNRQPHDCAGPPLGTLPADTRAGLERYMPGGADLMQHEWRKHGTCSGLTPADYFAAVLRLAQHADDTIGTAMRDKGMLEGTVHIADLLATVSAKDAALAAALVVDCQTPRGGGTPLVEELRLVLSKDFTPRPAQSLGLGQNSGCKHGAGKIPKTPH